MIEKKTIITLFIFGTLSSGAYAKKTNNAIQKSQETDTLINSIPLNRQMFTDRVYKAIRAVDAKDGAVDNIIFDKIENKSAILTQSLIELPKLMIIHIENSGLSHVQKINLYRELATKIGDFNKDFTEDVDVVHYKELMNNFNGLVNANIDNKLMNFAKKNATIYTLNNISLLESDKEATAYVYKTVGQKYPTLLMNDLPKIANEPYTDEIVAAAARVAPNMVLSYAAPNSKYRYIIQRNPDKLVKTIVQIADEAKNKLKVIPFLNQINDGEKTIAQIDKMSNNQDEYFKSLVNLKISGKAISPKELDDEIAYRSLAYIRRVNELHESSEAVRFKSVENFSPEEYYFILLGSQTNEIYTSSYLGIFKRMMAKIGTKSTYDLLKEVKMTRFRTFIRMAAGYNTIGTFLNNMLETEKTELLHSFVSDLEKGTRDDLEDAVDVADAFGSMTDEKLITFLKDEVKNNYERVYKDKKLTKQEKEKGVIVYGLLASIFNSSGNADNLQSAVSNIPPINYVDYNSLINEDSVVVQQVFFYGDEDGKVSYANFMSSFKNKEWKIDESNPYWTVITSLGSHKDIIYANKPLFGEGKDEEAQNKLFAYMASNNIVPTIVIHRGHSYHLEGSLKNLTPEVRIVMLGSCGGFHNLANVLDKAPDANIISTKQIGSYRINEPIIRRLNEDLLKGKNVNWIEMWKDLETKFSKASEAEKTLFSDYIPPNKNLGAIFIKAYRNLEISGKS
ncbi:MAG TPA: hypothetical protein PKX92_05805 [Edaphocola sp.]|nr:hypothetical protein [Edaphocola sp.]